MGMDADQVEDEEDEDFEVDENEEEDDDMHEDDEEGLEDEQEEGDDASRPNKNADSSGKESDDEEDDEDTKMEDINLFITECWQRPQTATHRKTLQKIKREYAGGSGPQAQNKNRVKNRARRAFWKKQAIAKADPEINKLLGALNSSFIDGQHAKAKWCAQKIIGLNESIIDPYEILTKIYKMEGGNDPAGSLKLFTVMVRLADIK